MNKWLIGTIGVLILFLLSGVLVKLTILAAICFAMYWCIRNHKEEWIKQVVESFKTIWGFFEDTGSMLSKDALKWLKDTTDGLKKEKKKTKK